MTIEDLRECSRLFDELICIEDQIKTMQSKLFYAKPQKINGMPKTGGGGDGADMLVKYIDLKDKYSKLYMDLADRIKAVEKALERLDSLERQAIRYRYMQGLPIYEVALKLSYTERQVHRILRRAESKLCG